MSTAGVDTMWEAVGLAACQFGNVLKAGRRVITYTVTDTAGATSQISRTLLVMQRCEDGEVGTFRGLEPLW
mgnify:CR=1 FL=1